MNAHFIEIKEYDLGGINDNDGMVACDAAQCCCTRHNAKPTDWTPELEDSWEKRLNAISRVTGHLSPEQWAMKAAIREIRRLRNHSLAAT